MSVTATWLHRPFSAREKLALALEIVAIYARARWWLQREGITAAVGRLRAADRREPARETAACPAAVQRLSNVAVRTLRPLPSDTRCLARSLVVTGLLARHGISSTFVIGVAPAPDFEAHAWVEHLDVPVLPSGNGRYQRLLEL